MRGKHTGSVVHKHGQAPHAALVILCLLVLVRPVWFTTIPISATASCSALLSGAGGLQSLQEMWFSGAE